ncbi:signal transduction histidine kinase/ligand-binding sensor domain-containing protein/DNA-binding response OmpR family regulator/HPt (histidine-containing phosphotransfer) domain-containing protein [Duganella sp. 3397]|uniref:response regulator n=1 Tax=Duganella sp. 3397 TaxID=2817732 RepID=UPI00285D9E05|nr:response regulator [Duganella sp. 3397]MDR7048761.1 signal transduction histidine kinase/ligand-binding sensor domain-containing protein/DNA-binding response OmpR family regulator/HPt (histidine-containing phosphotransfer) domain-containing protein [Duganella sp. 3397]
MNIQLGFLQVTLAAVRRLAALVLVTMAWSAMMAAPLPASAGQERWDQLATPLFEHLGMDQGLPNPVATALAQDGDGYIWVGTRSGLARWNGYHFRSFVHVPSDLGSLPGDTILALHVDQGGRLWVGTASAGLARFDPRTERFVRVADELNHGAINAIAGDGRGNLWLATPTALKFYDAVQGTVRSYTRDNAPGLPASDIRALLLDRAGTLWIGTTGGLARLRPGGAIEPVPVAVAGLGVWQDAVLALGENRQGQIAFGTMRSGIGVVETRGTSAVLVKPTGVRDLDAHMVQGIVEIAPGRWWATTYGNGIVEYRTDHRASTRIVHQPAVQASLAHDRTGAMLRDRSGMIWVATERGVDSYDPHTEAIDSVFGAEGQLEAGITALLNDVHNDVWIALGDRGLDLADPAGHRRALLRPDPHQPETALPNRMILALAEATPGEAWIGTELGLYLTSGHGARVRRVTLPQDNPTPRVTTILPHDGKLWLGTSEGLLRYDSAIGIVRRYVQGAANTGGLTDNRIHAMAVDAYGALWIATGNGLNRLEPDTGAVEQILAAPNISTELPEAQIGALVFDGRGRLWVGTQGGGVCVLTGRDAHGKPIFQRVGPTIGLPGLATSTIMSLQADQAGRVWAATGDSIVIIDASTFKARALARADGLAFRTFYLGASTVSDRDLIFGAATGMAVIYPDQLADWNHRPPVVVSAVRIDQRQLTAAEVNTAEGPAISLRADSQGFDVELAALDYSAPQRNRYAYLLEGFDRGWIEVDASRRIASYTHLPAGDYVLRMRGSNREGAWSTEELALQVKVLPPWHQTWWAWLAYGVACCLLAWGMVRWRLRQLHLKGENLQALVYSRTQHLEKLNAIVRSINEQLDFDALLHTILQESTAVHGVDSALALVREDGSDMLGLRAAWGRIDVVDDAYRIDLRQAEALYAPAGCEIAPDIFEIHHQHALPGDVHALLSVRVVTDGQVEGYLIFENFQYQVSFNASDIELLKALKEPFVSAYQKARALRAIERARLNAEAATRAKSEFLANISHEIRTPMNAILGFAGLGTHLDIGPQPLDYFRKIGRAGQSLLEIINDVLDFSKIESGKLELEALPFDLLDTLNQLADLFAWRASEQGLELVISATPEVPANLLGDPLRLSQILVNLVGNALKFTASGQIEVRVERAVPAPEQPVPDGMVALRFAVEDSGLGISPEQQSRLFQAFAQADASTTRLYGGTGLGLAISQQLVRKMGGVITVDSEPNVGSSFSFTVQMQTGPAHSQRQAPVPEAALGKRVLIVDDNNSVRHKLKVQLATWGLKPAAVASGAAAVAAMQLNQYDLLLIDAEMPDIDGIETLQRIAEDSELAAVPPVLMVSAYAREHRFQGAELLRTTPFIDKPVNPYLLRSAVLTALGLEVGQATAKLAPPPSFAVQRIRGAHVLVVDDNSINLQVASEILQRAGVRSDLAASGDEAARMINQRKYDAVLMDIQMPDMDGYQATALIRADERHASLPIIAMTAHAVAGYRERCLNMDMNDYVTKPINPETLYTVLAAWVAPDQSSVAEMALTAQFLPAPPAGTAAIAAITATTTATAAAATAAAAEIILPGIDVPAAMERLGGNATLLKRLLAMFAKDFEQAPRMIEEAIAAGRWFDAADLVHKVRGAAGNLSATELHETATALEDRLRAQHEDLQGLLDAFNHALNILLRGQCRHSDTSPSLE